MRLEDWKLSPHAIERIMEMALGDARESAALLREALERPNITYTQRDGAVIYQSHRIGVVTKGNRVLTIVWNRKERWSRDDLSLSVT